MSFSVNQIHRLNPLCRFLFRLHVMLAALFMFFWAVGSIPSAQAQASITVDASRLAGTVNTALFGNNVLFMGNAGMLWDVRSDDVQTGAKSLVQALGPTLLRFPGGSNSDKYLWEDGIGIQTATSTDANADSITLESAPEWGTAVRSGIFLDRTLTDSASLYGDSFQFSGINGRTLVGVTGVGENHPAGVEVRPGPRPGQPSWFTNQYGIDEHMKLAGSLGAGVIITVNYGTGRDSTGALSTAVSLSQKVDRAEALVAYLNGNPDDTTSIGIDDDGNDWKTAGYWAQLRAERGHPAPYGVKYFEIGNEIYGSWETGYTTVRQYAHDFIEFANGMKSIDPNIKVGAVTPSEPHYQGDADAAAGDNDEWASTLVAVAGDSIDFLALHLYYPAASQSEVEYGSSTWFTATMAAATQAISDITDLRAVIAANSSRADKIQLVVTEYGIFPFDSSSPADYSNLAASLFHADLLMGLMKRPDLQVTLATAFTMHDPSTQLAAIHFDWSTGGRWTRPQYHALSLMRNYLAPQLVSATFTGPTFSTEQVGNVQARDSIPVLAGIASVDGNGRMTLLVLNRGQDSPLATSIRLLGYNPQPFATIYTITGDSLAANNETNHSAVTVTTTSIATAAPTFNFTFPAHSLTLLQFEAGAAQVSPPQAVIRATPVSGTRPLNVTFSGTGSSSAPGTSIVQYMWDLGAGGRTKYGSDVSYRYKKPGAYGVVLTVTDSNGLTGTASTTITVTK